MDPAIQILEEMSENNSGEFMKYSDLIADWLKESGYTHCFFVAGGNIMHLLESLRHRLQCIPVVHEVAAGIAAEYFTVSSPSGSKACALVTAGPGLTNIVTAIAGAYLESRELLVIGGQVKTADLSHGKLRQRGIQEIGGVDIVRSMSVLSHQISTTISELEFKSLCSLSHQGRPGPVFLEIPLDIQGRDVDQKFLGSAHSPSVRISSSYIEEDLIRQSIALINKSTRPMFLVGGGVSYHTAAILADHAELTKLPLSTTWNGADRIPSDHICYFGRPNTWGQRYSNLLLQQADVIVALGTRLGLQQTGFNWKEFGRGAQIIQVDLDRAELEKGHPRIDLGLWGDVNEFLARIIPEIKGDWHQWHSYCQMVKSELPPIEKNETRPGFLSPYHFVRVLSEMAEEGDMIIPCSSGGAFTVMMQAFNQKKCQKIITNKGLASMGYGLSGAIGTAIANPDKRTILVEGDGGFSQNLQEVGTAAINNLNLKIFLFDDSGYASIRMTQRNYFGGCYAGCDIQTGLGLPKWELLFNAYGVPSMILKPGFEEDESFIKRFSAKGTSAFIVSIDPEQTYFPKITSRMTSTGMESNPLHRMSPELSEEMFKKVGRYFSS
jgi:acetolactate synthase-1/2/3 large subunit